MVLGYQLELLFVPASQIDLAFAVAALGLWLLDELG